MRNKKKVRDERKKIETGKRRERHGRDDEGDKCVREM